MTDQKQEKPKQLNWLIKAGGEATLATGVVGLASFVVGVPYEYIPRVALVGPLFSLYLSWSHSKERDKPKRKNKGRSIPFNHGKGSTSIYPDKLEFSIEQGGYVLRESYGQAIFRRLSGKDNRSVVRQIEQIDKPKELDEFVFYSRGLQLRQVHVDLFLKSAWRNRKYGKGLSTRRWIRNFSQRPAWYQELSPAWYFAMLDMLRCAGDFTGFYLVVEYENGWRSLANEPFLTMRILRWYEIEKRKS